jgi:hypothetical protein
MYRDAGGGSAMDFAGGISVRVADAGGAAVSILRDDAGFCGDVAWGQTGTESMFVAGGSGGVFRLSGGGAGGMAQTAIAVLSWCSSEVRSDDGAGGHAGAEQSALRRKLGKLGISDHRVCDCRGNRVLGLYRREEARDERSGVGDRGGSALHRVFATIFHHAKAAADGAVAAGNAAPAGGVHVYDDAASAGAAGAGTTADVRPTASGCCSSAGSCAFGWAGAFLHAVRAQV